MANGQVIKQNRLDKTYRKGTAIGNDHIQPQNNLHNRRFLSEVRVVERARDVVT